MSRSRSRSPFRTPPTGRSSVSLDTLAKIQSARPASPPFGGRRSAFRPPKNLKESTTCLPRVVCRDLFNCPELRSDETCLDPDAKPPFLWRRIDKLARDRGQENNTLNMIEAERPVSPPKRRAKTFSPRVLPCTGVVTMYWIPGQKETELGFCLKKADTGLTPKLHGLHV